MNLWTLNGFGTLSLHLDVSAIFLFVAGLVYLSCGFFAPDYLSRDGHPAGRYGLLHFALMTSVVLILTAGDVLTFLISWECMSILCYLLVNYEQEPDGDSTAGYIMLAMSEAGFLAVVIAFLIAGNAAGGYSFAALRMAAAHLSGAATWGVFLLGFLGFGVKEGVGAAELLVAEVLHGCAARFHSRLRRRDSEFWFLWNPASERRLGSRPWHWTRPGRSRNRSRHRISRHSRHHRKRPENHAGAQLHRKCRHHRGWDRSVSGIPQFWERGPRCSLTAALYHMLNHSTYKALLYQGAGHIEAATGTRDMDQLGGLIRSLPALSIVFLAGCLAIAAVPPFNGFVSEWLTLQTFLRSALLPSAAVKIVFALSGAILALTAALAVTCFREDLRHELSGNTAQQLEIKRSRIHAQATVLADASHAGLCSSGSAADLCHSGLEPRRGTFGGSECSCFAHSTVLYSYASEPTASASLPRRLS